MLSRAVNFVLARIRPSFDAFIGVDDDKVAIKKSRDGLFYLFIFAILASVSVFSYALTHKPDNLGTFGDFIGGTLNPILTFLTFMGLLITIVLQQSELRDTRVELKRSATALESQLKATALQNFEATFFQMLTLHNTIVNSLDVKLRTGNGTAKGRDAFKEMYGYLRDRYKEDKSQNLERMEDQSALEIESVKKAWARMWDEHQSNLGHYVRYLFNIIRFVDEYGDEGEKIQINTERYMKLLRSQLSEHELMMLFYNGQTDDGKKFRLLATKYNFYKTMPTLFLDKSHKIWLDSADEGKAA